MYLKHFWTAALFAAAGFVSPAATFADEAKKEEAPIQDSLDEVLRTKAPDLLKQLKTKKFANVGVLKFLVKKGDAAPSDNVGELNLNLANRLEVALVLCNPDEDLGIIQHASRTVSKENNVRANHLTREGRKAFFTGEYDLAWGPRKVMADAFVTGLVTIAKDLKRTTIRFQVFDKEGAIRDVLDEVVLETSPRILTEAGYSYVLNPERNKEAFTAAKKDRGNRFPRAELVSKAVDPLENLVGINLPNKTTTPPAAAAPDPFKEGPVKLTIMYNGKPQSIEKGVVAEPKETDVVTFLVENPTKDTYAVLLKVNGVNTLFGETISDPRTCHKWILRPGEKQLVSGFQIDDKTVNEFKVLSPKESEANEVYYGDHAGTFRMVCFKGTIVKEDPSLELNKGRDDTQLARAAIGRGTLAEADIEAGSLNALKRTLRGREKTGEGARGMIVQGDKKGKLEIERFFFKPEFADPVNDMTIRYYVPKHK
jgi:hypothetical protein